MANTAKVIEKDGVTTSVINGVEITDVTSYNIQKNSFIAGGLAELTLTFKVGSTEITVE